jgi:hypothetical protein
MEMKRKVPGGCMMRSGLNLFLVGVVYLSFTVSKYMFLKTWSLVPV